MPKKTNGKNGKEATPEKPRKLKGAQNKTLWKDLGGKNPKVGRPTSLTKEVSDTIVQYITAGCYIETAVACAGIAKITFYKWMQAGESGKSKELQEFSSAVKKAYAMAEARRVMLIGKAAADNWTAAAWTLERMYPERYGRRDRVEVGGGDRPVQIQAKVNGSDFDYDKFKQCFLEVINGARGNGGRNDPEDGNQ